MPPAAGQTPPDRRKTRPFGAIPMNANELWSRYRTYLSSIPAVGLTLDVSRIKFDDAFLAKMEPAVQKAYADMDALEKGAIANPDENRMVGHYWLRNAALSPTREIADAVRKSVADIRSFAADVHGGRIKSPSGRFTKVLSV